MAQDENILRGSHSGTTTTGIGGGRESEGNGGLNNSGSISRSKKVKQKRVPQRELGVAQLERIREEQLRKEALQAPNTLANNVIGSLGDSVQSPNFRPTISPSPNSMPSSGALHRTAPLVSNTEILQRNSCQIRKQVGQIGLDSISSPRHGNWPKSWNRELNVDGEKQRLENHELVYLPRVKLPYEANNVELSLPSLPPFQHPITMVNLPSEFSQASSLSSQMEPPSNQSFPGNNYPNSSVEEDKMVVGMKRPYPFSLESPPVVPSFRCNIPTYAASRSRTDDLASCSNRYTPHTEPRNKHMRESYSTSITLPDPERDSTKVIRDDERLKGDFLTLAPPLSADSPRSNSKDEHLLHCSGNEGQESFDSKHLHDQENPRGQILRLGPSESTERPFSFFPDKFESDQPTTRVGNRNDETTETIDLNLKL